MLGVMLAFWNFGVGNFLQQLEDLGFFSLVLPFLLIFAIVYAILVMIPMFTENKGAAVLVALAVGLLSLQLNFVSIFFQEVFPKFGIGLSLLLIALILAGSFISGETAYKWIFFGLGAIIFIVVMLSSLSSLRFIGSSWWEQYGALAIVMTVVVTAVVLVIVASKKK